MVKVFELICFIWSGKGDKKYYKIKKLLKYNFVVLFLI